MRTTGIHRARQPDSPHEKARRAAQRLALNRQVNPNIYVPTQSAPSPRQGDKPITFERPENPRTTFRAGPGSVFRR